MGDTRWAHELWGKIQEHPSGASRDGAFGEYREAIEKIAMATVGTLYAATAARNPELARHARRMLVEHGALLEWLRLRKAKQLIATPPRRRVARSR